MDSEPTLKAIPLTKNILIANKESSLFVVGN